jgi:hypothetical protein
MLSGGANGRRACGDGHGDQVLGLEKKRKTKSSRQRYKWLEAFWFGDRDT